MKLNKWIGLWVGILCCIAFWGCSNSTSDSEANYPARNVNLIIYSSAGGATDLANRALAEGMKAPLGVDVVPSNMPGALGGTATNYVWNRPHNGYTLAGISEGALGHSVLGLHPKTARDWHYFMVGGTPGILSVKADSPYKSFPEIFAAIKSGEKPLTIATSVPGSVWHIQWLNARSQGFEAKFIPYKGSFPSQTAALSGEVDMVWTGLGEQAEFIKSGDLRPLAVFAKSPLDFEGQKIPPMTDFMPGVAEIMPIEQFVGFAVPADTAPPVLEKLTTAFNIAMESPEVAQFSQAKYTKLTGLTGEPARQAARQQERVVAATLWEAGIAKVDPQTLGIEAP